MFLSRVACVRRPAHSPGAAGLAPGTRPRPPPVPALAPAASRQGGCPGVLATACVPAVSGPVSPLTPRWCLGLCSGGSGPVSLPWPRCRGPWLRWRCPELYPIVALPGVPRPMRVVSNEYHGGVGRCPVRGPAGVPAFVSA